MYVFIIRYSLLVMTERLSTNRTAPISKVFDYYSQIDKYPERYPRYCVKVDIIEKNENYLVTKEMWNVTIGELDHITVKVKYILKPYNEIKFEILEGYGQGSTNGIVLTELDNGLVGANLAWVPLEIIAKVYGGDDPLIVKMARYFNGRDVENYEGRQMETKTGDPCPFCKEGILVTTGKYEEWDKPEESRSGREFQCEKCGKIVSHHEIGLKEKLQFSDNVHVTTDNKKNL